MNGMRQSLTQDAAEVVDAEGPAFAAWSALSRQCDRVPAQVQLAEAVPRAWRAAPQIERLTAPGEVVHREQANARRRWRPVGSNDLHLLQRQIESCVRIWLRIWLPQPGAVRGHVRDRSNAIPASVRGLLRSKELSLTVPNSSLTWLAWRALDMARLEHEPVDEATRAIVAAMAEHMGADLEQRLRGLLPSNDSAVSPPERKGDELSLHRIDIDADQFTSMIEVNVAEDYFRAVLPLRARDPSREMTDRLRMAAALQASTLSLRGVLGTCAMRIGQFLNLQPGDLLVLNRTLHDPLPLYLHGQTQGPIASGTVGQICGRLALKLNYVEQNRYE